jgi:hypothetical protein
MRGYGSSLRLRGAFLVALLAFQRRTEAALTALRRGHPRPCHPGRVVPHMLAMPAIELGHPLAFLVLMEADDRALHYFMALGAARYGMLTDSYINV